MAYGEPLNIVRFGYNFDDFTIQEWMNAGYGEANLRSPWLTEEEVRTAYNAAAAAKAASAARIAADAAYRAGIEARAANYAQAYGLLQFDSSGRATDESVAASIEFQNAVTNSAAAQYLIETNAPVQALKYLEITAGTPGSVAQQVIAQGGTTDIGDPITAEIIATDPGFITDQPAPASTTMPVIVTPLAPAVPQVPVKVTPTTPLPKPVAMSNLALYGLGALALVLLLRR